MVTIFMPSDRLRCNALTKTIKEEKELGFDNLIIKNHQKQLDELNKIVERDKIKAHKINKILRDKRKEVKSK